MTLLPEVMLQTANQLGTRLCRDALWAGDRCNWLGSSMELIDGVWTVAHRSFGPELYNGTSGIALFLARLYATTPERLYRRAAEGAIRHALSRLDDLSPSSRGGFYAGTIGIAHALVTLGEVFDSPTLLRQAHELLHEAAREGPHPQGLDLIMGSAGALPALLNLHQRLGDDDILGLAIRHGEHLMISARENDVGLSWDTLPGSTRKDLTGFAHGAAGPAWALLELYNTTREHRYCNAAVEGFRYEQNYYDPEHQNWPDFREYDPANSPAGTAPYCTAWCHGAPGIGLSRLRAYEILKEEEYLYQSNIALQTTIRTLNQTMAQGVNGDFSLCHGIAGNAELVLHAYRTSKNPEQLAIAEQVGRFGIEQYEDNGLPWPCGVHGGGETPNLMLGLAGIGYFYLRLYDPLRTPSILRVGPASSQESTEGIAQGRSEGTPQGPHCRSTETHS